MPTWRSAGMNKCPCHGRITPTPHTGNSRHYCSCPPLEKAALGTSIDPECTSHRGYSCLSMTPPEGNTCSQAWCSVTFPNSHHHGSLEQLEKPFLLPSGSTLGMRPPWPSVFTHFSHKLQLQTQARKSHAQPSRRNVSCDSEGVKAQLAVLLTLPIYADNISSQEGPR